jgi:hypothetical protein
LSTKSAKIAMGFLIAILTVHWVFSKIVILHFLYNIKGLLDTLTRLITK